MDMVPGRGTMDMGLVGLRLGDDHRGFFLRGGVGGAVGPVSGASTQ